MDDHQRQLLERLAAATNGEIIWQSFGGGYPVQGEGRTVSSGEHVYFRFRHNSAQLYVGYDPLDSTSLYSELGDIFRHPDGTLDDERGILNDDEAVEVVERLFFTLDECDIHETRRARLLRFLENVAAQAKRDQLPKDSSAVSDPSMRSMFYDLDGMPIDLEQGRELMRDWESRVVAETQIETLWGTLWLATVHMVMDQADELFEEHVPVLYATRIHGAVPRRDLTGFRGKYATRPEAFAGHMAVLHDLIRDLGGDILTVWQKPVRHVA